MYYIPSMPWTVLFAAAFEPEFRDMPEEAQEALAATVRHLREFGPKATRPQVGTLKGSAYSNMKELRFHTATGEWRAAFAFDPLRQATCSCAAANRARAKACSTSG